MSFSLKNIQDAFILNYLVAFWFRRNFPVYFKTGIQPKKESIIELMRTGGGRKIFMSPINLGVMHAHEGFLGPPVLSNHSFESFLNCITGPNGAKGMGYLRGASHLFW